MSPLRAAFENFKYIFIEGNNFEYVFNDVNNIINNFDVNKS